MISQLNGLSPVSKGAGSRGWIGRIAEQVDTIREVLAQFEVGAGLDLTADAIGRVHLSLTGLGGDGGAGLPNSSFVATAKRETVNGSTVTEVRMLGGTVQGIFGEVETVPTTYWTSGSGVTLFDDYNAETDNLVVSQTLADGEHFWLRWDPQDEGWYLEHGTALPQNASASAGATVRYFALVPLFRVRLSEETAGVVQGHSGNVYVPTVKNVVDVQQAAGGGSGS